MTTIGDYKLDVSRFATISTPNIKLTGVMSMDENGTLYAASEHSAIYCLYPWSNAFELFAGAAGPASASRKARDGPRLGDGEYSPLVGPVTSIDALGTPGSVYAIDEGRKSVLYISTEEGGKVKTIRSDVSPVIDSSGRSLVASYPHSDKLTLANNGNYCLDNRDWVAHPKKSYANRFFHPMLTTHKTTAYTSSDAAWCHTIEPVSTWLCAYSTYHILSDRLLYPLATLSPNITLCVSKTLASACIGVIQSKTFDGIDSIAFDADNGSLQDNNFTGGYLDSFLFSPATNMMYAWNDTTKTLMRYFNVISSFTRNLLDLKESPFSSSELKLDLSSLRPTLLSHDLVLENKHSGKTWNVHRDILSLQMAVNADSIAKLKSLILTTLVPDNSIDAFVDFLYFKPLVKRPDWIKFTSELCYIIFLCEALGIKCASVATLLETQIDARLSPAEAADMLFDFWFDPGVAWSTSSPVISLLARKTSRLETCELLEQLKSCRKPTNDGVRAMELACKVLSSGLWQLERIYDSFNITLPKPTSRILIDPERSMQYKTDFNFNSDDYWTIAKGWVLYPRWSWFKKLIDLGMEESKSRIVVMPSWVTVNMMRAIITTVYQQDTGSITLNDEEMTLMLERGIELDLVDSSKSAVAPFEPLIGRCKAMLLCTTTKDTCLRLLRLYHRLQLEEALEATLAFVTGNRDSLAIGDLGPQLNKMIEDAAAPVKDAPAQEGAGY